MSVDKDGRTVDKARPSSLGETLVSRGSRMVLSAGASSAKVCAARTSIPIGSSQRLGGLSSARRGGNVEDEDLSSVKARILTSQKNNLNISLSRRRESVPPLLTEPTSGSFAAAASPTTYTPKASVTVQLSKTTAADDKRSHLSAKVKVSQQQHTSGVIAPLRPRPASSEQNSVKARRRAEIYAINAYLRSLEMKKFDDFKLEMQRSSSKNDCVDELSCISWSSSQSSLMPSPTYRSAKEKGATYRGKSFSPAGERKKKDRLLGPGGGV